MRRLVILLLPLLLLAGCEKDALDRQMQELCKKDGGVKVFEKIKLPPERFDDSGKIKRLLQPDGSAVSYDKNFEPDYKIESSTHIIKDGDPIKGQGKLVRYEYKLIRTYDNKIMAISVSYSRIGGDFIIIDHWSSSECPNKGESLNLAFIK